MSRIRLLILCMLFELFPAIAFSQPVAAQAGWLESMRLGGYVIVLRHGLTTSDQASPDPMANPAKSAEPRNTDPMSNPAKNSLLASALGRDWKANSRRSSICRHASSFPRSLDQ